MFFVGILRFQERFDVDILDLQIKLLCRYLGIFWLGNCFGYFLQNLGDFFQQQQLLQLSMLYNNGFQHNGF
jgi:hypothetical protein